MGYTIFYVYENYYIVYNFLLFNVMNMSIVCKFKKNGREEYFMSDEKLSHFIFDLLKILIFDFVRKKFHFTINSHQIFNTLTILFFIYTVIYMWSLIKF